MNDPEFVLYLVSRIVHIGTAIVLVGGTVFMRLLVMPAATEVLDQPTHDKLRARVMSVWKRFVHGGIALFLISGGINYYRVIASGAAKADKLYHPLVGTKILLALAIFFIASALVGKSAAFDSMRKNAKKWLTVNIILATIVVALSGFVRMRDALKPRPVATPPVGVTQE